MSGRCARWAAAAGLVTVLAGCAAGPDFSRPAPPHVANYAAVPLTATAGTPGQIGGAVQHVVKGASVSAQWWRQFRSPALDALEKQALAHNPTLAAARASLRAAHEATLAGDGSLYPTLAAGLTASREQDPSAALAPVPSNNAYLYSLFTPQLSVGYSPDVFGLQRRTRESLRAQEQVVRFEAVAAWNSLTTNVAVTALRNAALTAQVRATRHIVAMEAHSLKLLRARYKAGDASRGDVAAQQAQLAGDKVNLALLVKQQAVSRHALAVLVGQFPGQWQGQPLQLSRWHLPTTLPLSLPSQLVAQRPDIRAARAQWHAASAAVGIAAAERLPQIQLSADVGATALALSKVFTSGTGLWGVAASLTAPLFDGGELKHNERAAKAAYVVAANQYRATVLDAFRSVADTLSAIRQDAKALKAASTAAQSAHTALQLAQLELAHGAINRLQLLAAEQAWQQARISLIQARSQRFADTAALYQALGGGWQHRRPLTKTSA
ncbi:MAG TPA: efflux transporter outer membrane subunit [Rhodanobacteraceae bacterium]